MTVKKRAFDDGIRVKPTSSTSSSQGDISVSELGVTSFRGTYIGSEIYTTGDHVAFNDKVYIAVPVNFSGIAPSGDNTNNANWNYVKDADDIMKVYLGSSEQEVVTTQRPATMENKTIDGTSATGNNTITADASNMTYDDTSQPVSSLGTDVQSALDAVKVAIDGQNEASEIAYDNVASGLAATDVQAAIDEVDSNLDGHIADAVDAHDASAISYDNTTSGMAATETQSAIDEVESRVDTAETNITANASSISDHIADAVDAHDASAISYDNTTSGLAATEVNAAIDEVKSESDTALSNHIADTSTHGVTGNILGTTDTQTVSNKTIIDALINLANSLASGTNKIRLSSDTFANLSALPREANSLYVNSDTGRLVVDNGTTLVEIDPTGGTGAFDAIDTFANLDALGKSQGKEYYATDVNKIYTDDGTQLNPIATEDYVNSVIATITGSPAATIKAQANSEVVQNLRSQLDLINIETSNTGTQANPALTNVVVTYTNSSGSNQLISGIELTLNAGSIPAGGYVKAELRNNAVAVQEIVIDENSSVENLVLTDSILANTNVAEIVVTEVVGDFSTVTIEGNIRITTEGTGPVTSVALNDVTDVDVAAPTDGQVLKYNSTTGNWEAANETVSGGGSGGGSSLLAGVVSSTGEPISGTGVSSIAATQNEIIDGTFPDLANWNIGGSPQAVANELIIENGTSNEFVFQDSLRENTDYVLTFDYRLISGSHNIDFSLRQSNNSENVSLATASGVFGSVVVNADGSYTRQFNSGTGGVRLTITKQVAATASEMGISNVVVREVTTDASTELVSDPTFANAIDTGDWVSNNTGSGTASITSGQLTIPYPSSGNFGSAYIPFTVTQNTDYKIVYDIASSDNDSLVTVGTTGGANDIGVFNLVNSATGAQTISFNSGLNTSLFLNVSVNGISFGTTVYNSFSIKQLQPSAASYGYTVTGSNPYTIDFTDLALTTAPAYDVAPANDTTVSISGVTNTQMTVTLGSPSEFTFEVFPQNGEGAGSGGGSNVLMPIGADTVRIEQLTSYTEAGGVQYPHYRATFDPNDFAALDVIIPKNTEGSTEQITNGDFSTSQTLTGWTNTGSTPSFDASGLEVSSTTAPIITQDIGIETGVEYVLSFDVIRTVSSGNANYNLFISTYDGTSVGSFLTTGFSGGGVNPVTTDGTVEITFTGNALFPEIFIQRDTVNADVIKIDNVSVKKLRNIRSIVDMGGTVWNTTAEKYPFPVAIGTPYIYARISSGEVTLQKASFATVAGGEAWIDFTYEES